MELLEGVMDILCNLSLDSILHYDLTAISIVVGIIVVVISLVSRNQTMMLGSKLASLLVKIIGVCDIPIILTSRDAKKKIISTIFDFGFGFVCTLHGKDPKKSTIK